MRIAFVTAGFGTLSETFVVNQIRGVIARGHDVEILACGDDASERFESAVVDADLRGRLRLLPVLGSWRERWRYVWNTFEFHKRHAPAISTRALNPLRYGRMAASGRLYCSAAPFVKEGVGRYDVIHCQFGPLGALALRLRQIGAIEGALVTAFRGYDATQYLKSHPRAYRALFSEGEMFLPVCAALARELIRHGCRAERIEVHHSGIELQRFPFRKRALSAGQATRLITVARLVEKKGIRYAIDAVGRAVRAGLAVEYCVVGDGPERGRLTELIEALGLERHVQLLGWRQPEEVRKLLDAAHILMAPSVTAANGDQEGIPNVLKEAMAMGLPVIATEHGGNAELVENGASGFLAPERDVEGLRACIIKALEARERWPEMGNAGRRRIEQEFDIARLSHELEHVYSRAVERYHQRRTMRGKLWAKPINGVR